MKYLSSRSTKLLQLFNLLAILFFVACGILLYQFSKNINFIYGMLIISIIWGGFSFLYLKLNEVCLEDKKFIISNLLRKVEIDMLDFEKIEEGVLPLIYKIIFKKNGSYHFVLSNKTLLKGLGSLDPDFVRKDLTDKIE